VEVDVSKILSKPPQRQQAVAGEHDAGQQGTILGYNHYALQPAVAPMSVAEEGKCLVVSNSKLAEAKVDAVEVVVVVAVGVLFVVVG
jgi:hypothetical protein